jgi:hypothetical protein
MRPHLQNNQSKKWTGGVAHVVEHLVCKHEALSSNLSPPTQKKKKKRKKERKTLPAGKDT